jgi:hypothetical protein
MRATPLGSICTIFTAPARMQYTASAGVPASKSAAPGGKSKSSMPA